MTSSSALEAAQLDGPTRGVVTQDNLESLEPSQRQMDNPPMLAEAIDIIPIVADGSRDVRLIVPANDVLLPEFSIVVPALDEEITIGQFVDWCMLGIKAAGIQGEVLII